MISHLPKKYKIIIFPAIFFAALLLFALALEFANSEKIPFGVSLAKQNFGGLNYGEAQEKINQLSASAGNITFQIYYQKNSWQVSAQELGISFRPEQTLQNTYNACHNESFLADLAKQINCLLSKEKLNLAYDFDQNKFNDFLETNLSPLENPVQNASLKYSPEIDDFLLVAAQDGEVFDKADLKKQIEEQLSLTEREPIELKRIVDKPVVTEDKNNFAKTKAKKIIASAPYYLTSGPNSWTIEKQTLIDWLNFIPSANSNGEVMDATISQSAINDFLSGLTPSINQEPVNAQLTIENGEVTAFALSQNGRELKINESAQKIANQILQGANSIELVVDETPAQINTQTIDTLGLTSLLGEGVSNFAGSPKNRTFNIGLGATKLNDILVKPGEEFSFVSLIGEIDGEHGYLPELVIKNNKTIPEYGGGLCQVSTTLFRAAVNSGLKITERYPHAFPVRYYNPQGFDATVYPPHPDLRFLNDTPNNILIQSKIKGTQLIFEIYGTDDGRQTKIIGPTILQSNPDGSMKAVLYQEIWRDGVLERKDTFRSNYKSPALYPVQRNPLE